MANFEVTEAAQIMGALGGNARAKRHSQDEIQEWGRLGGRPPKLKQKDLEHLRDLLADGRTLSEVGEALGISTRTASRYIAKGIRDHQSA